MSDFPYLTTDEIFAFVDTTGPGWTDKIRALWANEKSRYWLSQMIATAINIDRFEVPIKIQRCSCNTLTLIDGYHRVAAAHAINMALPVEYIDAD